MMNGIDAFPPGILPVQPPKPRLLVAEDDVSMRRFLEDLLGPLYEVEAVEDGEKAWSALQRHVPALLLTDLQMPDLDGLGLIRRVRGHPHLGSLPIVLLTATQEAALVRLCLAAGADDFLLKPFSCVELLACIQVELLTPRAARDREATYQTRLSALERGSSPGLPSTGSFQTGDIQ